VLGTYFEYVIMIFLISSWFIVVGRIIQFIYEELE
jgi:hypothetical protein